MNELEAKKKVEELREEIAKIIKETWWEGKGYKIDATINLEEYPNKKASSILSLLSDMGLGLPGEVLTEKDVDQNLNIEGVSLADCNCLVSPIYLLRLAKKSSILQAQYSQSFIPLAKVMEVKK